MNVLAFANTITITIIIIIIIIAIIIIILYQAWLEDRFRQVQRLTCSRVQVQIDHKHFGNRKLCRLSPLGLWSKAGCLCMHHCTGTRTMATQRRWRNGSTQSIGRSGIWSQHSSYQSALPVTGSGVATKIDKYEVRASRGFPRLIPKVQSYFQAG